jgi:hypothetical protein
MKDIQSIDYLPHSFFTTDPSEGFIKVAPRPTVTEKSLAYWNKMKPTIGIVPSGWSHSFWKDKGLAVSSESRVYPLIFITFAYS